MSNSSLTCFLPIAVILFLLFFLPGQSSAPKRTRGTKRKLSSTYSYHTKNKTHYIYGYTAEPKNYRGKYFYIGRTTNMDRRHKQHMNDWGNKKADFINEHQSKYGYRSKIKMHRISTHNSLKQAQRAERNAIRRYKPPTNMRVG